VDAPSRPNRNGVAKHVVESQLSRWPAQVDRNRVHLLVAVARAVKREYFPFGDQKESSSSTAPSPRSRDLPDSRPIRVHDEDVEVPPSLRLLNENSSPFGDQPAWSPSSSTWLSVSWVILPSPTFTT